MSRRVGAELGAHHVVDQLWCHRRRVGLQRGQRAPVRLRHEVGVDEGQELADLHHRALHAAHHLGGMRRGTGESLLLGGLAGGGVLTAGDRPRPAQRGDGTRSHEQRGRGRRPTDAPRRHRPRLPSHRQIVAGAPPVSQLADLFARPVDRGRCRSCSG